MKRKLIKPSFWDDRLRVYLMPTKDPLGFGDVLLKLELWDGSFCEMWVDPNEIYKRRQNRHKQANMKMSFEEWFEIFQAKCKQLGYNGPIDKGAFYEDYDEDIYPEEAAESFVNEMTE